MYKTLEWLLNFWRYIMYLFSNRCTPGKLQKGPSFPRWNWQWQAKVSQKKSSHIVAFTHTTLFDSQRNSTSDFRNSVLLASEHNASYIRRAWKVQCYNIQCFWLYSVRKWVKIFPASLPFNPSLAGFKFSPGKPVNCNKWPFSGLGKFNISPNL